MKKLAFIFLLCPLLIHAQFNKGLMYLGGTINAQGSNSNNDNGGSADNPANEGTSRTLAITPRVGYFLNEKWSIGASLGYSFAHFNSHYVYPGGNNGVQYSDQTVDSHSFSAGIFGRRYIAISEKFLFAMEGNLRFARGKSNSKYLAFDQAAGMVVLTDENAQQYDLLVGMRPVFLFFPSPRWGVEAGLGVLSFDHQQNLANRNSGNTFVFTLTTSLSIGLSYYFRRK